MSTDLVVKTCPVCGGDGTSAVNNGEIYCVDCNRTYVLEPDVDVADPAGPLETRF